MKRYKTLSVGEIIDMAIDQAGSRDVFDAHRAAFLWCEVVGQGINRQTSRRWVSGSELHVCITSPALKNDLQFLSSKIVQRINDALGKQLITKLVIH